MSKVLALDSNGNQIEVDVTVGESALPTATVTSASNIDCTTARLIFVNLTSSTATLSVANVPDNIMINLIIRYSSGYLTLTMPATNHIKQRSVYVGTFSGSYRIYSFFKNGSNYFWTVSPELA